MLALQENAHITGNLLGFFLSSIELWVVYTD